MQEKDYLYDVVVLTEAQYINPTEVDEYVANVLLEDKLVVDALIAEGFTAVKKSWDDPELDWSKVKMLIFRTTWDYHHRFDEFRKWLDKVEKTCALINPSEIIFWNIDKHYLQDLNAAGVRIVPSDFIDQGTETSLKEVVAKNGWENVVLKPTISAAARNTYKILHRQIADHEAVFKELISKEDMIIQPFINSIETKGEISMMVFGGKFSHAILKLAKKGDFRVQDDFGGTVHDYEANADEIAFAEAAVKACTTQPLYARVDVVWGSSGALLLSELELIEPELWFRNRPESAVDFARVVKKING